MTGDHEEVRQLLGPYVLGGLAAADRREFEEHLSGCEACRSELARFAAVPGILRRLPGEDSPRAEGAPGRASDGVPPLLPGLLAAIDRDRRRRRHRTALRTAVIAATVAALAVFGIAGLRDTPSQTSVVTLTASGDSSAGGDVALVEKPWGTALTVRVSGLPGGGPFVLEVTRADGGEPERAATWAATPDRAVEVLGASSIPPDGIARISVRGPDGQVLTSR